MEKSKATVARIRPVSWKVCVVGEKCTKFVRDTLCKSGFDCSPLSREPELHEPAVFSFLATPDAETPLTAPELQAILNQNDKIEVLFEA